MVRVYLLLILFFHVFLMQAQQDKGVRIINFAGMEWYVRSGQGNPGHNLWSDDQQSVWVDYENRLHLKVRKINGKWYGAEIRSLHPTRYGTHRFYVASRVDTLDPNLVAAVFIYRDDEHETDIEFSRWTFPQAPNAQYVVQPETPESQHKFHLRLNGDFSTHVIDWHPDSIRFHSWYGHFLSLPHSHFRIDDWTYQGKRLPDDNRYRIHINLWMIDNRSPSDNQEAELIIASVDTPISPLSVEGPAHPEISMYPNHYYDHMFVYLHTFRHTASYDLYRNGKLLETQKVHTPYFFLNLIDYPIGQYDFVIHLNHKDYLYQIQKRY